MTTRATCLRMEEIKRVFLHTAFSVVQVPFYAFVFYFWVLNGCSLELREFGS